MRVGCTVCTPLHCIQGIQGAAAYILLYIYSYIPISVSTPHHYTYVVRGSDSLEGCDSREIAREIARYVATRWRVYPPPAPVHSIPLA
jgi:hypothetical protein